MNDDLFENRQTPPSNPVLKQFLGVVFGLLVVYGFLAYSRGWFPFADISGESAHLKDIITKQLNIPLESVELTGDTTAVGKLASGEELAIYWKRTGNEIKCICQKPQAQAETDVRNLLTQLSHTPKTVSIKPSRTGVGYVGEATTDTGLIYDVTDDTDTTSLQHMLYVILSPRSYPLFAKVSLEKELNAKVTEEAAFREGDLPPLNEFRPGIPLPTTAAKKSLFRGRFKTNGKWFGVELYQEPSALAGVPLPGQPQKPDLNAKLNILYRELE